MEFEHALPTGDLPRCRFLSEGGIWELGFRPELFGNVSVVLGQVADDAFLLYYPTGADLLLAFTVLAMLRQVLERYPEATSPASLRAAFPLYDYKPIDRDQCLGKLMHLATGEILPSIVCPQCDRVSYNPSDIAQKHCGRCQQPRDQMPQGLPFSPQEDR